MCLGLTGNMVVLLRLWKFCGDSGERGKREHRKEEKKLKSTGSITFLVLYPIPVNTTDAWALGYIKSYLEYALRFVS
jgi:hypothetical protein